MVGGHDFDESGVLYCAYPLCHRHVYECPTLDSPIVTQPYEEKQPVLDQSNDDVYHHIKWFFLYECLAQTWRRFHPPHPQQEK